MVGKFGFTYYSKLFLLFIITGISQGVELDNCPASCMCLGEGVDCTRKGLSTLPKDMPVWVSKLNMNSNRIHSLDKKIFENLTRLEDLKLNKNKITKINKDMFKNQKQLRTLELNRNQLDEIDALSFKSLEQLVVLKLKRNHIKNLPDGAFWGLKNISTLELDYNYLSVLSKVWLYGLNNLKVLSLSNNEIVQIGNDVWEFCKELKDLNLATNLIATIQKNTFRYLSELERLNLSNNNISYIEEGVFLNTPNLKILYLNSNKLSWIVEDTNGGFVGLGNLEKIYLASNQIKSICQTAFDKLKNIELLDVSNNNITTLQDNAFSDMVNLKVLVLNTSMLVCDCNLQWFGAWLRESGFTTAVTNCAYPDSLQGKSIKNLASVDMNCEDVPKPRLIEEPKSKKALKGENISFFCKALSSSKVPMKFVWKRDNIELSDAKVSEKATSPDGRQTEQTSELKLYDVDNSDQGKYQCIVSNSFGTTYSQKSRLYVLIFPVFIKIPMDMNVSVGTTARMECAADGEPQPQIAWQKDGGNDFPAARERRMHVMPEDDVFFIVDVKAVDMGIYSCTAKNAAGIIVANATLRVEEEPSFVKPMENKEITAGEPIVIQCMVSGSPKPSLTWLKDGEILKATERHFFTAEDQLMIIVDTALSDAGKYECFINNTAGNTSGFSELTVIPRSTVSEDDMMGIIIITVVCCAVGTSIVWVVIIYQTRKRITATNTNGVALIDVDARVLVDTTSEHSSCKDSGTGDSVKHSSISDNVTLLSECNGEQQNNATPNSVAVPINLSNSNGTLLQTQRTYPRSTNHDREQEASSPIYFTKQQ